jgi:hypothetical protein
MVYQEASGSYGLFQLMGSAPPASSQYARVEELTLSMTEIARVVAALCEMHAQPRVIDLGGGYAAILD